MLVLTRKLQEKIHINDNITITVVRLQGNTVRIGIEAPADVRVVRGEVAARDLAELAAVETDLSAGCSQTPVACRQRPAAVASHETTLKPRAPLSHVTTGRLRLRRAPA